MPARHFVRIREPTPMNIFHKLMYRTHLAMIFFAMFCLVSMVLITFTNVILRYVFNTGLQWGEETTLVLVIWFTFIAMAMGVKLSLHISISILPPNLPAWLETLLTKIKRFITLAIGLVFLWYGIRLVGFTARSILPATHWPAAVMYVPIPLISVFIIWESIIVLFDLKEDAPLIEKFFMEGSKNA